MDPPVDMHQTSVVCARLAGIFNIARKPARTNGSGAVLWMLRCCECCRRPAKLRGPGLMWIKLLCQRRHSISDRQ